MRACMCSCVPLSASPTVCSRLHSNSGNRGAFQLQQPCYPSHFTDACATVGWPDSVFSTPVFNSVFDSSKDSKHTFKIQRLPHRWHTNFNAISILNNTCHILPDTCHVFEQHCCRKKNTACLPTDCALYTFQEPGSESRIMLHPAG